jgi:hypothetical protein
MKEKQKWPFFVNQFKTLIIVDVLKSKFIECTRSIMFY